MPMPAAPPESAAARPRLEEATGRGDRDVHRGEDAREQQGGGHRPGVGGASVYPAEIEGELQMHPQIADVAVLGIPHPDWGEEIKAVVEPVAGAAPSDGLTAEILAYAASRLEGRGR